MSRALKYMGEVLLFVVMSAVFVTLLPVLIPVELFLRYREDQQLKRRLRDTHESR